MIKRILTSLIVIGLFISFTGFSYADEVTLPNGQVLNTDKLNDTDILNAIKLAKKSMDGSQSVTDIVKDVNPENLEAWSKLITGTIKNVCNDLNVTVNDFVKTPVGIGVAALIAYKIAGKDLLDNALDIIIMVPLWFLTTGIILYLGWYFFSNITVYDKIYFDDKGKKVKEEVKRISRYSWEPKNRDDDSKSFFAGVLIAIEIVITILSLLIILI